MEFFKNFWVVAFGTGILISLILYLIFGIPNRELVFGTTGLYAKILLIAIALSLVAALITSIVGSYTTEIRDWYDLDAVRNNLGGNYVLMNNLDRTTAGYEELASSTANAGKGWQPIRTGDGGDSFCGTFDGQGLEIRDLFINRPDENYVGLFGQVGGGGGGGGGGGERGNIIKNVGVVNVTVTGKVRVGGLVGCNFGDVSKSYSSGYVNGDENVGGLVGSTGSYGEHSTVSDSYSTGNVSGNRYVGGLAGFAGFSSDRVAVRNCYSTANVSGNWSVGGLTGASYGDTVSCSFWDTQTSGLRASAGGTAETTLKMQDIATFSGVGWDITTVMSSGERNTDYTWNIVDHETYPFLSWQS